MEKLLKSFKKMLNSEKKRKVTAVVIGAGNRGKNYACYALDNPDSFQVVAVAEPRQAHRQMFKETYKLPNSMTFSAWEEIASLDKIADVAIITTPDQLHKPPALAFAKKGYHILLEKPMAVIYDDCCEIVETCEANKVILAVCHVLRYMPQAQKIKSLIDSGAIGKVMNIQLLEPVGFYHFAHSYVRGNWRNTAKSSFSLLAKSCHDIDLIQLWMGEAQCLSVQSFGSLQHFTSKNKPKNAASRCLDCPVEESCQYSAKKIYLDPAKRGYKGWPLSIITPTPDIESVTEALRTGPYGRCVYECDNDVCDNQVVNLQYDTGATVSFTMVACTEKICERQVRIFGDKGELSCDFQTSVIRHYDFLTRSTRIYDMDEEIQASAGSRLRGHGNADFFAMMSFVDAVQNNDPSKILTGPQETLLSHYLVFMAEKSRLENRVVTLNHSQEH